VSNLDRRVPRALCPLCAGADTAEIAHLPSIPTNNSIVFDTQREAAAWPSGSFRLVLCRRCGFLFNADFDARLVEYSDRIEETQAFSPHFMEYAQWIANDWIDRYDIRHKTILEIGCGKAEFLKLMCDGGDNRGIGYDPAVHTDRVENNDGRLTLVSNLFDDREVDVEADVLVCRHTLEHIADVNRFLGVVHRWATRRATPPVVLFEVPDVARVLEEVAFWDLFYEHCSYFTRDTLRFAFERSGFDVVSVRHAYDGQYLVVEARPRSANRAVALTSARARATINRAESFASRFHEASEHCRSNIDHLARSHPTLALWGAGSKAVSLLTSLEIDERVDFAIDINPHKQGKYLVGTGHPIYAPERLLDEPATLIVVMNPVYVAEVERVVSGIGVDASITTINDLLESPSAGRERTPTVILGDSHT
jgi:hypothetical protein